MKERMLKGSKKKSPVLAAVASIILPGAGQAYNREIMRAIIFIFLSFALISWGVYLQYNYIKSLEKAESLGLAGEIAVVFAKAQGTNRFMPLILYVALVVFCATDAYTFAAYIARNITVETEKEEFNLPPPKMGPAKKSSGAPASASGVDK